MDAMAFQITSLTIVYSTIYSGANQRKQQSSASLAFVLGVHRWPANSSHKGSVTRKMFPFDDVIMWIYLSNPPFLLTFGAGWVGNVLKPDIIRITTIWPNRWWRNTKIAGKGDPYQTTWNTAISKYILINIKTKWNYSLNPNAGTVYQNTVFRNKVTANNIF